MCVGEGGGGIREREKKKNPVIIYAHGCTPINCREEWGVGGGKENEGKLVYSPPCGRPVFLCERRVTLFWRDEGWEGPAGGV